MVSWQDDHIREDKMNWTCSKHVGYEKLVQKSQSENLKGK
jgi:hypothetical protein